MEFDFNDLFNNSYEFVLDNEEEFFERFYQNFTNSDPLIRDAFKNTDMEKQKSMLRQAIVHMVMFFSNKKASDYFIKTSITHKDKYCIPTHLYDNFVDTLISTLQNYQPNFNNETAVAWRITLAPGIEFMKHISLSIPPDANL